MRNEKIRTHNIPENFQGETVFLRYVSENDQIPAVDYAHKDDYYLFLFIQKGYARLLIDFKEYEIHDNTVLCILPGQVHLPISYSNVCGWILAVDAMFVKDEYKKVFDKLSFLNSKSELNEEIINELKLCISLINKRFKLDKQLIEQSILHDLVSSYIGIIAEIYQKGFPAIISSRFITITSQFKSLLSVNYRTLKRPSQYASELNISAVYLNEVIKKTTGFSVRDCILNEIIIQAKRLLFYTDLTVKEIALNLGYEDWAYFTRLFTKAVKITPSRFRKKHLK